MSDDRKLPGPASEDASEGPEGAIETTDLVAYAGLGGAVVCCAVIEVLGGAVILGGLAAFLGLSTGTTYLMVGGLAGIGVALAAYAFHRWNNHRSA